MGLFDAIDIAASGLSAERTSMDVTAENLANAQSANYQRQDVVLQAAGGGGFQQALAGALATTAAAGGSGTSDGVRVAGVVADPTPGQLVYDPGNPAANGQGYVRMPNISPVTEMVNLIDESNSYQSDVTAMQTAKDMFTAALGVLK
jgi:flagellar basal-body rod protein FlgC